MDIFSYLMGGVVVVIAIVLVVAGVQVFFVMQELRRTLARINDAIDTVESRAAAIASPFQGLGGIVGGVTTGMKVFELFVNWLHRTKNDAVPSISRPK